jgi:GT2 family glycosyltransferase
MLEYAQRLAPSDGRISLAIGLLRLILGEPRAAEPLEMLTTRTDWRDVWMALVLVRVRFGHVERAAVDLHTALMRNSAPRKRSDIELATVVTQQVGARGWCALDNQGTVIVGATGMSSENLRFTLDGTEILPTGPQRVSDPLKFRLPKNWHSAKQLEVFFQGSRLIGSPLNVERITRVEGFVEAIHPLGELRGWCWFPAEAERIPAIAIASLADPRRRLSLHARSIDPKFTAGDEFALPRGFSVEPKIVESMGKAVTVTGPHGRTLYGSPIWPRIFGESGRAAAEAVERLFPLVRDGCKELGAYSARAVSVPVPFAAARRSWDGAGIRQAPPRPVDVIIPVYRGLDMTLACIASVRAYLAADERIIVVSDATPEPELTAALSALASRGHIVLQAETKNRGFPGAANVGLRLATNHDAVLLNSDTVVTPGWLASLRAVVHSAPDIGTATPLSNDATIFSYPRQNAINQCPDATEAADLAEIAANVNRDEIVDVPTGHGFCLYIRSECLEQTGLLREDVFAQGYGEENDFCMRARHLGWRHIAAPGIFIAHYGSGSFNPARGDLVRRNLETLNRLHLGYDQMIAQWQQRDPLFESRRRIDLERLKRICEGHEVELLITHDRAGGVRRFVTERLGAITRSGRRILVLRPENKRSDARQNAIHTVLLDIGFGDHFPNLRFRMPDEREALALCLKGCFLRNIEINSLVGHDNSLAELVISLGVSFDLVVHDYSWFCPRITLTKGDHRYCGEPAIAECRNCIADYGTNLDGNLTVDDLVARSERLFKVARSVLVPSRDVARRIAKRFGHSSIVSEWEAVRDISISAISREAGRTRTIRVCVVGAISYEKGYDSLLSCARIVAANDLLVEFLVVGHTCDDGRLLDTGTVRITGRYDEAEVGALIAAQNADFAWLPAVWPETWSYVMTDIWEAGLPVIVHDIGTPAERVRTTGGGLVVPLNLPSERLVALFLDPKLFRANGGERQTGRQASKPALNQLASG